MGTGSFPGVKRPGLRIMGNDRERRRMAVKMGKENLKIDIWSNER
jgi:hypothetical protein